MSFLLGRGTIYNQTWEDPHVDAEALAVREGDVMITLASGGCNVLNAALLGPTIIHAIDHNPAQIELLSLKIAGAKCLGYEDYWGCFGTGDYGQLEELCRKMQVYPTETDKNLRDRLPCISSRGLYRTGRLNTLYTLGSWIRRACSDSSLERFAQAETIEIQRGVYFTEIKPRLWNLFNRYVPSITMFLYGVSWSQIRETLLQKQFFLKDLFEQRLDHLFTSTPIRENYFWQRIFYGKYPSQLICPPYLQCNNFDLLKTRVARIRTHNISMTNFLKSQEDSSITVFNLSDLPDFLGTTERNKLWDEVARTSRPEARILYRNFAAGLPTPKSALAHFELAQERSIALSAKEMTGSYAETLLFIVKK